MQQVQVFGESELIDRIERGESHCRCLISIGNPLALFAPSRPGTYLPRLFKRCFDQILRLSFFDVESVEQLGTMRPKRVPELVDAESVLRFFESTKAWTDGWTVHCWQGLSRSPAVALGLLYLIHGDEEKAGLELQGIRPDARPHQNLVRHFDRVLGSGLEEVNARIRDKRIEAMRMELDLDADMLLEELPATE